MVLTTCTVYTVGNLGITGPSLSILQEVQWILTNAELSKDSDFGFIMVIFVFFEAYLRNKEIIFQNNIAEKYYKIGRFKLC